MNKQELIRQYIDADIINRVAQLELNARRIIEGYLTGRQRTHFKGYSVEFASHREYTQGDDLRHLDWKVFARTDKLYVKEYELETNINSHIILDVSKSMMYGSGDHTKFEYACAMASAIAYLLLMQHDSVGLSIVDTHIRKSVPSLTGKGQIFPVLETIKGAELREGTDLINVMSQLTGLIRRKTFVIIISDLLDGLESIKNGFNYIVGKKNELMVLHILDQREMDFNFREVCLFEGLEDMFHEICDPTDIRKAYLQYFNEYADELVKICATLRADYNLFSTHKPLEKALPEFLIKRLEQRV